MSSKMNTALTVLAVVTAAFLVDELAPAGRVRTVMVGRSFDDVVIKLDRTRLVQAGRGRRRVQLDRALMW